MKATIRTKLSISEIADKLNKSKEFINGESNNYGKRLKYEHAVNQHFIEHTDKTEFFISQNAGYGGINETFAFVSIGKDNSLHIKFKTGGFPFNWTYKLFLWLGLISLGLLYFSLYFTFVTLFLVAIAFLIRKANDKSAQIIIDKIKKSIS